MMSNVEPGTANEEELNAAEIPEGTPLMIRLICGAGAEPAANASVTV